MIRSTYVSRRGLARAGIGLGAGLGVSAMAAPSYGGVTATADEAVDRKPILVGANPAVQLFDEHGDATAYVSCWRVDWSVHGAGTALVFWQPDSVQVYGENADLSMWLADYFVRWFPELDGLPWTAPRYVRRAAHVELDLATGMRASAGELSVEIDDVLDVRSFSTDEFPLRNGQDHSLHLVLGPCASGRAVYQGRDVPGMIHRSGTPERPGSSAFVTEAEVWRRGADDDPDAP